MRPSDTHCEAVYFGSGIELTDPQVVARFTVEGEPMTKARARVVVRNGKARAFTPDATKAAQARVTSAYLESAGKDRSPIDATNTFGVRCVFFRQDNQRRDVDNMLKLILDGLTGYLWKDDSQVTEVFGRKTLASPTYEPRTEVVVYYSGIVEHPTATCEHCGEQYRTYDSWAERRFCTDKCHYAWRRANRTIQCRQCGADFDGGKLEKPRVYCSPECNYAATHVEVACVECGKRWDKPKSLNRHGNSYCSDECRAEFWRKQRKTARKGDCQDCGGPVSKKTYKRCAACNTKAGGHWESRRRKHA